MPVLEQAGLRLNYLVEGREDAPWLILSNSLGTTLQMWAPQMPELLRHFRVLRYDTRGHGGSSVPAGPYTIDRLGGDVLALMDALGVRRAHFCGLSMGGMTGIWMGVHQQQRLDRLVLCNTAAQIGPASNWNARIEKVRGEGMEAIVLAVIERWFTGGFAARAPEKVDQVRAMLLGTDREGYVANCAAVRDMDQRDAVARIGVPTLVIAGTHDLATPAKDGKWLSQQIPGARYLELDAAHLSNWEQPARFTDALTGFLLQEDRHG
ncbi:3-oxoadipate enol-lactonase [Noviherbaspirillum aridicola]|uniref:3-oxoadipate enol-lactonase n=1 Tax=Noviherbaspirillum aridicola TaxID=2849687 RepID=A0ABQ4Q0K1_9BURK|nr:3-oxoadipate enol-lactonase [Noviherbaspirillum aridicola]GIZ50556.1 3-oxoadipate enol-lactonase [Noviherbaspirillum aridicola]